MDMGKEKCSCWGGSCVLSTKDDCVGARERQYSSARPAELGPEWVSLRVCNEWYLWLSGGLEPSNGFVSCVCAAFCLSCANLGYVVGSLATLFSLAKPAHAL